MKIVKDLPPFLGCDKFTCTNTHIHTHTCTHTRAEIYGGRERPAHERLSMHPCMALVLHLMQITGQGFTFSKTTHGDTHGERRGKKMHRRRTIM